MATPKSPDGIAIGPAHIATGLAAVFTVTASLTPSAVATIVTAEQTFNPAALAGLQSTDYVVLINAPARTNSILIGSVRVSATGTVAINYVNPTAGSLTPPAGNYTFLVIRPDVG